MTEKELISKLKDLNSIKPRKEWVFSVKMQILGSGGNVVPDKATYKERLFDGFKSLYPLSYQRKLAYSFSVLMLTFVGVLGFAQYTVPGDVLFSVKKITEQGQASLTGESEIKASVENFKKRSQDLAEIVKNKKETNIPSAVQEVKDAAKSLTDALQKDPKLAKEIALEIKENKTFLDLSGEAKIEADIKEASDILYKTIDAQMIADLEATTLTEEQQVLLEEIKDLYSQDKYSDALEKILLISVNSEAKVDVGSNVQSEPENTTQNEVKE